ncbi:MAG: hypothetical protein Q9217_003491 [Psora testacea]
MRIAIEGCGHGTLHAIYASVQKSCNVNGWNGVDLLIIGGDFQAVRNSYDLNTMSVPQKFRAIGDFHEYYSGVRTAPVLTLFVGGNHEASSHLHELFYGGWVAPKIYYLGAANIIRFGGLRIAGLSGIWKGYNYNKPHFEKLPYSADEVKSIYHVRELDVRKLLLVRQQVDIGISHDWPRGIEWQGDYKTLFKKKDLFEADARAGILGSSAAKYVMDRLRPRHWFSAHLHCKFAAVVDYYKESVTIPLPGTMPNGPDNPGTNGPKNNDEIDFGHAENSPPQPVPSITVKNSDEIDLDMDEDSATEPTTTQNPASDTKPPQASPPPRDSSVPADTRSQLPVSFSRPAPTVQRPPAVALPPPPSITNRVTRFLALDKCLPNRKFLQILDIEPLSLSEPALPSSLYYDPEWLAILRAFASSDPHQPSPPNLGDAAYQPLLAEQKSWVEQHLVKQGKLEVPENFEITGPVYDGRDIRSVGRQQPKEYTNSQTSAFCELLGIPNYFHASEQEREEKRIEKQTLIQAEERVGSNLDTHTSRKTWGSFNTCALGMAMSVGVNGLRLGTVYHLIKSRIWVQGA